MANTSTVNYQDGDTRLLPDNCQNVVRNVKAGELQMEALGRGHYPGQRLPRHVMPGLKSMGFIDVNRQQCLGTGWHYNEGIEVCYLENGHVDFMTEKAVYQLQPGDVTVTWPWQRHCLGNPKVSPSRLYWLMLDVGIRRPKQSWCWPKWIMLCPNDRDELTRRLASLNNPVFGGGEYLSRCFRRIGKLIDDSRHECSWSLLTVLVNEVFALLLDQLRDKGGRERKYAQASLQLVGQFWQELLDSPEQLNLAWTLPKLAKKCGFGTTQFVQHTQALTNVAPMHYLRQCRLQRAAKLLLDDLNLTVTDISQRCGFSSGQYFATAFRRYFGCSPQTYRCMG
ncbi:MAG: AraC family transcriptional regulator [Pirellulales bacterium]|nr:AraC family transcriptional regulator [Pirellulales bacterium]